ncbi:transposable element Tcb1 transposase [Trichonephila clavipes]|nr:transposable element Tcb1 transposase [Trichonephila clavipes]
MSGKRARRHFSQLSEFERGLIIGMKTAVWSTRRVAGQVDRSECTVRNCWENWTREGTHAWKTESGATWTTTRREDQRIVQQALVDPTATRLTIRADVGVAIVPQTIYRHLAEANLKSKRPFRALPLTPELRQLRLQWCQARSMWNVTDWQKVVFSDESRFVWGTGDNRVRVWRRPAYDSRSTLIVMRGTLTGPRYVDDILRPHVGPFLNGFQGAIFQQDNARPHTARVAQDFLRHCQTLPLPARSPDLSPVEHSPGAYSPEKTEKTLNHAPSYTFGSKYKDPKLDDVPVWSTRRVAVQVDRSECTVRNCWENWTREGTHAWKTESGATWTTTRREDQRIVQQALVDPTATRLTIRADVGVAIVPQTIYRHLAEANLKSKRPFRALPLTPELRQLRLQWCQARSMWNVTDWQKVVFSDESRFVWGTGDNRVRVWRRPGERYNSPHTVLCHTARTAGVMVWGP